jgi:hypothetical protein
MFRNRRVPSPGDSIFLDILDAMKSDEELRTEAERLVDLDDRGSLIEDVTIALRLGDQSDLAADELDKLDREFLDEISSREVDFSDSEG